jgi:hypothetical protein
MPVLKNFSQIILQDRDRALMRGLFESRIMTAGHIAALHFNGSKEAAKKRLQKLKAAGYVSERKRGPTEPAVLFLTAKAFSHLRGQGILIEYPSFSLSALEKRASVSAMTLNHELEVMDVKATFHSAIGKTEKFSLAEFSTWPLLHQFEATRTGFKETTVKPDGFIRIHEKEADGGLSEHTFFLEVDRSSETQDTLVNRAACYLAYYQAGGFAMKNGATRNAYKEYPFRVLMVFKNAERRNNTAARLLQNNPPIFTQVCLSTYDEVTTNPLGPVWVTPAAYREAVKGTRFDIESHRQWTGYRRQPEREALVEQRIQKLRLLESE